MKNNLLKSMAAVSSMTFISRVLGFIRDAIIARVFGVSIATDAFFVAFKLPNLLRRIFAEGAFSQAFVPILAEYKTQEGEEATRTFVAYIAGLLSLALAFVTLIGVLCAPFVIYLTAPGFADTQEKFELTTLLLRITFPYILLISLSSLCGAILNTWNRFSIPAFAPTLLNFSMIGCAIFLTPYVNPPVLSLAIAVLIGGLLQLAYQLPYLHKIGMLVLPRINLKHKGVWLVLTKMIPAIIGVSAGQISLILNTIFASFLVAGSVSWMYYADRLMEFPAGILGVALGTILLPSLSKYAVGSEPEKYNQILDWGLRLSLLLALPASIALGILAEPLTVTLFQYNAFTENDSIMTQRALIAYAFGLLGLIMIKVLAPGFYARKDTMTPFIIAFISVVITQIMNALLIMPLGHVGLALSIGIGATFNASALLWQLIRQGIYIPGNGWLMFLTKLVFSVMLMGMTLYGVLMLMPAWDQGGMLLRVIRLLAVVVLGVGVYFTALYLFGFRVRDFIMRAK